MGVIKVQGLREARAMLGRVRKATKVPDVQIWTQNQVEDKIRWMGNETPSGGRNYLQVNDTVTKEMADAFAAGLLEVADGADPTTPWRRAGQAYLARLQKRITFSGADLNGSLRKLSPAWIKRKHGSTRLAYWKGDLQRAIMKARVVIRSK